MSLIKKIVCMFLIQGIFSIQTCMPNDSNNIFPKTSKNKFYLHATGSIVGICLLYGFYFFFFKINKQNKNQPVQSNQKIDINKIQLIQNNTSLKEDTYYNMQPPGNCTELVLYSNIVRKIYPFDGNVGTQSEHDYLVARVSSDYAYHNQNNPSIFKVTRNTQCFFNYQLWSIKREEWTNLRYIRYCDDIQNIDKYFEPFNHEYSIIDHPYPLKLFLFDGPNKNSLGLLAYNTKNSDGYSFGSLLCLDLKQPSVEIPKTHLHSYTKHELQDRIITAAALHPNDNIMLYATAEVIECNKSISLTNETKYTVEAVEFDNSNDEFKTLSRVTINYYLIKVIWACNKTWYGLTNNGNVVKAEFNLAEPRVINASKTFDHIAIDQSNVDDQSIKIVGIKNNGCVNLYNASLKKMRKITDIKDYKKEKVSRLSVVDNQIGLLLNNSGAYDYDKLYLYSIGS